MSAARSLLVGATVTAAAATAVTAVTVQGARAAAMRRRISWSPGAGTTYDGALHARIIGDGPTGVMLLHGLGGSSTYWGRAYDTLASAGRLVVPDLLGFGDSPTLLPATPPRTRRGDGPGWSRLGASMADRSARVKPVPPASRHRQIGNGRSCHTVPVASSWRTHRKRLWAAWGLQPSDWAISAHVAPATSAGQPPAPG